jgi:anti-anti-sigma factor
MTITSSYSPSEREMTIRVSGRFDFSSHQEFRQAYADIDPRQTRFVIDLGGAEYIDSAALGMLLLLRERAGGEQSTITLTNCGEGVMQILGVSNFDKLFLVRGDS